MTATTQDFWTEIRRTQGFQDAVAGVKLLIEHHGLNAAIEMPAFDAEVQRAVRGGNIAAGFCCLARVRGEQFSAAGTASDGDIVRALVQACGIFGDYIFVPAVAAASLESFYHYD